MLQFMGLKRVGHDGATELTEPNLSVSVKSQLSWTKSKSTVPCDLILVANPYGKTPLALSDTTTQMQSQFPAKFFFVYFFFGHELHDELTRL